ncbi:hypothetical protein [Pseudomonas sp.]|uniref:hypothetical protein n=1 Tax=Pseudomonas sp. TaxID=306 RepID=UPI0029135FDE|nr:hypothetical protein [Pseudomonas sp.]MDU4254497.1 hypothetical protein [Pseudomonas sp.]
MANQKDTPETTLFWVELVCDKCADTTSGTWARKAIPRREMKAEAKKAGWVFEGSKAFCSEQHRLAWHEAKKQS